MLKRTRLNISTSVCSDLTVVCVPDHWILSIFSGQGTTYSSCHHLSQQFVDTLSLCHHSGCLTDNLTKLVIVGGQGWEKPAKLFLTLEDHHSSVLMSFCQSAEMFFSICPHIHEKYPLQKYPLKYSSMFLF